MINFISLHPPLSAFPWALVVTAFFLELISFFYRKSPRFFEFASVVVLLFAVIGGVAAFFSGLSASKNLPESLSEFVSQHFFWARLALFALVPTLIVGVIRCIENKKILSVFFVLGLAVSMVLIGIAGYHGGNLNFERIRAEVLTSSQ